VQYSGISTARRLAPASGVHLKARALDRLAVYALLLVFSVAMLFPIVWMISSSFKARVDLFVLPPQWIPLHPTLANFQEVLGNAAIRTYALNSIIVSSATTAICVVLASLAGYSLSRFRFPGRTIFMIFLLATQMFPLVMFLIPLYRFWNLLQISNTLLSLILSYLSVALPLPIWLMKSFFDTIPTDLEEAAMVDGCSRWRALWQVVFPLAAPGILASGLFAFLASWDEYMYTFTLISQDHLRTLPVGLVLRYFGQFSYDWDQIMTLSLLMSLPIMLLFTVFQRYLVQGLTTGAVKG
jgi:ABC-type glycerol-3-phosphate transport system permease component